MWIGVIYKMGDTNIRKIFSLLMNKTN